MRRTIFSLTTLALFAPAVLSAQTSASATGQAAAAAAVQSTGKQATTDAAAQTRIDAAIQSSAQAGVPRALLESKLAEGRAKGASMARIATAVEHRAEVLTRVHSAMAARGHVFTAGELNAAADAHERGVSLNSIAQLSARAGNDRSVALTVLADLVASGRATPSQALLDVESALNAGANALVQLGSSTAASMPSAQINSSIQSSGSAST